MMTSHGNGIILDDFICLALLDINKNFLFHDKKETEKTYTTENHTNNFPSATLATLVQLMRAMRRRLSLWFLCRSNFLPQLYSRPLWRDQSSLRYLCGRSSIHDEVSKSMPAYSPGTFSYTSFEWRGAVQALSFQQRAANINQLSSGGHSGWLRSLSFRQQKEPQLSAGHYAAPPDRLWWANSFLKAALIPLLQV